MGIWRRASIKVNYTEKHIKQLFPTVGIDKIDKIIVLDFQDTYDRVIVRIACNGYKNFYQIRVAPDDSAMLFEESDSTW